MHVRAERSDDWRLILTDHGRREVVTARVLINASGPWAGFVAENVLRLAGAQAACGWSRAVISWCRACFRTTAAISCNRPTAA